MSTLMNVFTTQCDLDMKLSYLGNNSRLDNNIVSKMDYLLSVFDNLKDTDKSETLLDLKLKTKHYDISYIYEFTITSEPVDVKDKIVLITEKEYIDGELINSKEHKQVLGYNMKGCVILGEAFNLKNINPPMHLSSFINSSMVEFIVSI